MERNSKKNYIGLKQLKNYLQSTEPELILITFQICSIAILFYYCWLHPTKLFADGIEKIALMLRLDGFSKKMLLCSIQSLYLSIFPHFIIFPWLLGRTGVRLVDIAFLMSISLLLYVAIPFLL